MTHPVRVAIALALIVFGWHDVSRSRLGVFGPSPLAAQHSVPIVPPVPPVPHVPPVPPVPPHMVQDEDDDGDQDAPMRHGPSESGLRTITVARQFRAARDTTGALHVDVAYGSGMLAIAPAGPQWLYSVSIENPIAGQKQQPVVAYDSAARVLRVNSGSEDRIDMAMPRRPHDPETSDLRIGLARAVPLDIALAFGAGEGKVQLGGLSVRRLKVETGASKTSIGFDAPNPIPLETLDLEIGAAKFEATGLGNANVRHMSVQTGVGAVDLDFGGTWKGDISLDVTAAIGAVSIHVPPDVVIDRRNKAYLGALEDNAGAAVAPSRPGAPVYHLRLTGTATLGAIELDRHSSD